MRRTVFYSWQSDLPGPTNRSFIEQALKRAIKVIHQDETESVEPVIDRDTVDVSGSPDISTSIFAKITLADVFVCDVSIINSGADGRLTPNPNVLIELGYAIAQLGWDRVLLVQNAAYGGPVALPFDLRGRRIISYDLTATQENKAEVRGLLQGRLETALRSALQPSTGTSRYAGRDVPLWWGHWNTANDSNMRGGSLFIYEVGPAGFLFTLSVFNGSHSGELCGYARIVAADLAYARIPAGDDGEVCEVVIRRRISEGMHIIEIAETIPCTYWRGMGANFGGTFLRKRDFLFEMAILDELDLSRLYRLVGNHFENIRDRFDRLTDQDNVDEFGATVCAGGVRGLFTIMEAIVMRGEKGELWVAYIDDEVVRYFTTESDYKNTLPRTIESWRERFQEKEVVYSTGEQFFTDSSRDENPAGE